MNEVLEQLKRRKSVRQFENKEISKEMKRLLFESAFQAPTAGCQMLYTMLDITDDKMKKDLSVICDDQPFIATAPLVLIFLADTQRWYDSYTYTDCNPREPEEGDLLLACADALIAAQNTVVAAESLGLGSCYIGDVLEHCEQVRALLKLPDYVMPAAMLVYGYPTESQRNRRKPVRFEEKFIVQENTYRTLTKEEHFAMHQYYMDQNDQNTKSVKERLQAFCERKYMSDFSKEMSRSARKYLEKFRGE